MRRLDGWLWDLWLGVAAWVSRRKQKRQPKVTRDYYIWKDPGRVRLKGLKIE